MSSIPETLLCLAAFLMFVSPPALVRADNSLPKYAAEAPLLDCDGTPCVEATIGEAAVKVKLGIDTGNVVSVLDTKIARSLGLNPPKDAPKDMPAGMYRAALPPIHVGRVVLDAKPALAMNLGEMIEQHQMPRVDGTLAYTAFKDRAIELDFPAKRLRISDPLTGTTPCAGDCDKIRLLPFGKQGPPIVVAGGFEINGQKVSAQIDTMYTGSLLVYTQSIGKLGLGTEAKSQETEMFPLTDGGVAMRVAKAKSESFHGARLEPGIAKVYFPTAGVHEPGGLFDATAGLALMRDAVVTLDFHQMTITVKR